MITDEDLEFCISEVGSQQWLKVSAHLNTKLVVSDSLQQMLGSVPGVHVCHVVCDGCCRLCSGCVLCVCVWWCVMWLVCCLVYGTFCGS